MKEDYTGWIKLHRKLLNWEWYEDANVFRLFIHCLLKANTEQKTWKGLVLERGQFFTSISNLGSDLRLSDRAIRRAIEKLIKSENMTSKGANKGTTITVLNYDSYQENKKQKGEQTVIKGASNGANKGTTTKEVKEVKNNKEIEESEIYRSFAHLSITREECRKLWRAGFDKQEIDDILDSIENNANNKKYTSLYLTANNWLKRDHKDRHPRSEVKIVQGTTSPYWDLLKPEYR